MHKTKYSEEEKELLDYIENEQPDSVENIESEKERYRKVFIDNASKRKQVSLRLLEADLTRLRSRALAQGIPYQTLISSIIHQYVNGDLVSKD